MPQASFIEHPVEGHRGPRNKKAAILTRPGVDLERKVAFDEGNAWQGNCRAQENGHARSGD